MSLVFEYDMPDLQTDDGKTVPDSTAKFVLLALADHCNDEGEGAYPGVKRICKKTSMSNQTVCNALNALRHNGYTTLEGKSKSDTNNYTINMGKFQPLEFANSSQQNSGILAARVKPSINHPEPSLIIKQALDLFKGYFGKFLSEKELKRWTTLSEAAGFERSEELAEWAFKKEIHLTNRAGLLDSLETAGKNWKDKPARANGKQKADLNSIFDDLRQELANEQV